MLKTPNAPQCLELKDLHLSALCWHSKERQLLGMGTLKLMPKTSPWRGFVNGVQCQMQELDSTGVAYSTLDKAGKSGGSTWNYLAKDAVRCYLSACPVI